MDELLEQFIVEGRDLVAEAEAALDRLGAQPDDMAAIDALFRTIHTLKGSVQIFNLAPAERLLHAAEDRLTIIRRSEEAIDPAFHAALTACVDQTDRWIDDMEREGRLAETANAVADRLLGGFAKHAPAGQEERRPDTDAAWLGQLQQAAGDSIANLEGALIAFRYTPDRDCFFRGDDPLAIVATVPGLEYLTVQPVEDWPSPDDWDPFLCHATIEGVSSASVDEVRAAFRLVPDQVEFRTITNSGMAAANEGPAMAVARSLRVDTGRIDELATEVGELVVAANALAHITRRAERIDPDLAAALRAIQVDVDRIGGGMHRTVSAIRRVPLAPTLRKLPRLVREIAASAGKTIRFEMRGETVEIDKQIADSLFEPLLHIIRNSIDHGIEDESLRVAAGKDAAGRLLLTATRRGDEVVVAVTDDGRGIDPARIRDVAVERGLIDRAAATAMSDAQALYLILAPGFSTAPTVTDLSGRGVGMDAVKVAVERLRGSVEIESRPGIGTTIELRLPLDAITTRLLVIRSGDERYGVPLDQIVETARLRATEIRAVGRGRACVLRDRTVPLVDLPELLGGAASDDAIARLLVTQSGGERVAVRVDAFEQRIDAIIRKNDGLLRGVPGMAGSALLSDGSVLLVLDLPELTA